MLAGQEPDEAETRLRRLVQAGIRINAERSIEAVLQRVVDAARELAGARYSALGVLDSARTGLARFVTSGLSAEEVARIGEPPRGRGILGVLIHDPRPLRLPDLRKHPKASGLPPNHPEMRSFLGVPVLGRAGALGNLYLAEKIEGPGFTEDDEAITILLAAQAAVALENAALDEQEERLLAELRAVQESRDRFFAMINHEMRNALTAITGWAELLLRRLRPEPPREAREVYESSERTLALLNDLLDLSRIEADRLRPALRDVDAAELVTEAVAAVEPAATKRGVRIVTTGVESSIPCHTDPQRIRQILINVLGNAVRHSPVDDDVAMALSVADGKIRFAVTDHGPGIPESDLARIFEAFARGADDERGTGLGLTLSRQLATILGGELRVESVPGAGATFILVLPCGSWTS